MEIYCPPLLHARSFCIRCLLVIAMVSWAPPSTLDACSRVILMAEMDANSCSDTLQQTKKIAPFITCETPFSQHVCELAFGVYVFDLDLGSKLILSDNPSTATLWFPDTCLILITASLSSKCTAVLYLREICVCGNMIEI